MKVLVVGSGGREHALIRSLARSPEITALYCAPGNAGIACDAVCLPVKATDIDGMSRAARENEIDFAVVAPDDPLVMGMVDRLEAEGIPCFGPDANAAVIEGSKVFSKGLMKKYGIPTADYETFDSPVDALGYIKEKGRYPAVVKADGLALGKGVVIAQNEDEAAAALRSIMEDKVFGASGSRVVVEEFLTGPEVSVLAFTDGRTICPMVSSMDHKRALDGDKGLNTGGMGTVAPNPHYTEELAGECMERIFLPTVRAMNREGRPFKGCLYFGLMLTPDGPKVIEYNCRFGDPETQVVLPLLETDLFEIMRAVREERLDTLDIRWKNGAAACVIAASGGYPAGYDKGFVISGLDEKGQRPDAEIFHAGTAYENGSFVTAGGRVLGAVCTAATLGEAVAKSYSAIGGIRFNNMYYRHDIGKRALDAAK